MPSRASLSRFALTTMLDIPDASVGEASAGAASGEDAPSADDAAAAGAASDAVALSAARTRAGHATITAMVTTRAVPASLLDRNIELTPETCPPESPRQLGYAEQPT